MIPHPAAKPGPPRPAENKTNQAQECETAEEIHSTGIDHDNTPQDNELTSTILQIDNMLNQARRHAARIPQPDPETGSRRVQTEGLGAHADLFTPRRAEPGRQRHVPDPRDPRD
jgi:hypothetical protein